MKHIMLVIIIAHMLCAKPRHASHRTILSYSGHKQEIPRKLRRIPRQGRRIVLANASPQGNTCMCSCLMILAWPSLTEEYLRRRHDATHCGRLTFLASKTTSPARIDTNENHSRTRSDDYSYDYTRHTKIMMCTTCDTTNFMAIFI